MLVEGDGRGWREALKKRDKLELMEEKIEEE
jgi:hypothetical protein